MVQNGEPPRHVVVPPPPLFGRGLGETIFLFSFKCLHSNRGSKETQALQRHNYRIHNGHLKIVQPDFYLNTTDKGILTRIHSHIPLSISRSLLISWAQ